MSIAETSKSVYFSKIKGKLEVSQERVVLDCLRRFQNSMSAREISTATGIELSSVARTLNNIKKAPEVLEVFKAKCRVTDVRVQHYRLSDVDERGQKKLF